MIPQADIPIGFLDPQCPINWAHPLNRGLVSEWAVIPNSGWCGGLTFRDLVRGGKNPNDGTLTNGPTWSGQSPAGGYGSLSFTAANTAYSKSAANSGSVSSISLSVWFKCSTATEMSLASSRDATHTGFAVEINGNPVAGSVAGTVNWFQDGGGTARGVRTNSTNWNDGAWHLTTCVASGDLSQSSSYSIYVDGVAQTSLTNISAGGSSGPINQGPMTIGRNEINGVYLTGNVSSLIFHNRALTAQEVSAIYAESKAGNPSRWNWVSNRAYFGVAGAAVGEVIEWRLKPGETSRRQYDIYPA